MFTCLLAGFVRYLVFLRKIELEIDMENFREIFLKKKIRENFAYEYPLRNECAGLICFRANAEVSSSPHDRRRGSSERGAMVHQKERLWQRGTHGCLLLFRNFVKYQ
jgi:hypothetical protein